MRLAATTFIPYPSPFVNLTSGPKLGEKITIDLLVRVTEVCAVRKKRHNLMQSWDEPLVICPTHVLLRRLESLVDLINGHTLEIMEHIIGEILKA
jgi:hypothetical protein